MLEKFTVSNLTKAETIFKDAWGKFEVVRCLKLVVRYHQRVAAETARKHCSILKMF